MDNPEKHLLAKIGQYALIKNANSQILLLERARSKSWSLPGGRLDKTDNDWNLALTREISEETHLNIQTFNIFDINIIKDPYQIKYCVYFIADLPENENLVISKEHTSSKWVDLDDISHLSIEDEPHVRKVLEHFFESIR